MTLTDELKFLNKKINASQAQYDFESETIINIYIVETILEYNNQSQRGQGLKIITKITQIKCLVDYQYL